MTPGTAVLGVLLALPVLAIGILLLIRRSPSLRALAPAILLSGVTTAVLAACFGFTQSTMPIRPYESAPWIDLALPLLSSGYVGFGVGAVLSGLLGVPAAALVEWMRRRNAGARRLP
jgi:hypothetical protein